ncbi:MAG: hypothetical protein HYV27_16750 [Candidatus Hydrogenedentes bacterium]|nr:hypothetical protein [Candidatus Hydrogenedentota bacterium]
MNMERVEERCLAYLKQVQNPLAPVEHLLEYCRKEEDLADLDAAVFLDFLRNHAEIHVLEGPEDHEAINLQIFSTAGLAMGPRAILFARIPTQQEMTAILAAQLMAMQESLGSTFVQAQEAGDLQRADQIRQAMAQVEELRDKLKMYVAHEGR